MYPGDDDDPEVLALAKKLQKRSAAHQADLEGPAFNPEMRGPGHSFVPQAVPAPRPPKKSPRASRPAPDSVPVTPPLPSPSTPAAAPPLPPALPSELAAALLSELRMSRQERDEISQEIGRLHQEVGKLSRQLAELQGAATVPRWLIEAAGDPRTYDAPDPARKPSGLRLHPALTKSIAAVQSKRSLRSVVGATEYLLRLGLAVDEKIITKR